MRTLDVVTEDILNTERELEELRKEKQKLRSDFEEAFEKLRSDFEEAFEKLRSEMDKLKIKRRSLLNERENIINTCHKKELFKKYNYKIGDQIAEKVYAKAWQRGHSNGLGEVESEFDDLIELFSVNA